MPDYSKAPLGNNWADIWAEYSTREPDGTRYATRSDRDLADICAVHYTTVRQARLRHNVEPMTCRP